MIKISIRKIFARYDDLLSVTAVLTVTVTLLSGVLCFDGVRTERRIQKYISDDLSVEQSTRLSAFEEQAGLPATAEIRETINTYEANVEAEKQRWLADQERRVAKLRKKREAKEEKARIKKCLVINELLVHFVFEKQSRRTSEE